MQSSVHSNLSNAARHASDPLAVYPNPDEEFNRQWDEGTVDWGFWDRHDEEQARIEQEEAAYWERYGQEWEEQAYRALIEAEAEWDLLREQTTDHSLLEPLEYGGDEDGGEDGAAVEEDPWVEAWVCGG